jgi:hypothetical protein
MKQLGESLFHHFHHYGRIPHVRLGYQKVEIFGHHYVADDDKAILLPGMLQDTQEQVSALATVKLRTALVTTTGYEVKIVATVPALQTSGHADKVPGSDHSRQ